MGQPVVTMTAQVHCSFGITPYALIVLPDKMVLSGNMPVATISDSAVVNVATFGMCSAPSNPEVAAATAAALGVLTPMPCVPVLTPWIPVSTTLVGGEPAVTASCQTMCAYGGVVEILPGGGANTLV